MLKIKATLGAIDIYPEKNNRAKAIGRIRVGQEAVVLIDNGAWLFVEHTLNGWVERKKGQVYDTAPTQPPEPAPVGQMGWMISFAEKNGYSLVEQKEKDLGHPVHTADGNLLGGLPDVERTYSTKRINYYEGNKRLQKDFTDFGQLAYEVFKSNAPDLSDEDIWKAWLSTTKDGACFTDHTGGLAQNPIVNEKNAFYIADVNKRRMAGQDWYKVRTLKLGKYSYMKEQLLQYPKLAFNATISSRLLGGMAQEPFGQLGGRSVKILIFSYSEFDYLPADRMTLLPIGSEIPNSYNPPRDLG